MHLFKTILKWADFPTFLGEGLIIPIPKKIDRLCVDNHRSIIISNCMGKLVMEILLYELMNISPYPGQPVYIEDTAWIICYKWIKSRQHWETLAIFNMINNILILIKEWHLYHTTSTLWHRDDVSKHPVEFPGMDLTFDHTWFIHSPGKASTKRYSPQISKGINDISIVSCQYNSTNIKCSV